MKLSLKLASITVLLLFFAGVSSAEGFTVIVNKKNSQKSLSSVDVKRIFLLEQRYWDNGKKIMVTLPRRGRALAAFKKGVLDMDEIKLSEHWQELKQISGKGAPMETLSDASTLRVVSSKRDSIGLVSSKFLSGLSSKNAAKVKAVYSQK